MFSPAAAMERCSRSGRRVCTEALSPFHPGGSSPYRHDTAVYHLKKPLIKINHGYSHHLCHHSAIIFSALGHKILAIFICTMDWNPVPESRIFPYIILNVCAHVFHRHFLMAIIRNVKLPYQLVLVWLQHMAVHLRALLGPAGDQCLRAGSWAKEQKTKIN